MSSYAVVKRMSEDRVYLPGEVLVDPVNAGILMERGFIVPVPDNFTPPADFRVRSPRPKRVEEPENLQDTDTAKPINPSDADGSTDKAEPEEPKTGQEPGQDADKDAGEETKKAKLPKKIDLSDVETPAETETQVGA